MKNKHVDILLVVNMFLTGFDSKRLNTIYVDKFNAAVAELQKIAPTFDDVNELETEHDQMEFVKAFRQLMRTKNVLDIFTQLEAFL